MNRQSLLTRALDLSDSDYFGDAAYIQGSTFLLDARTRVLVYENRLGRCLSIQFLQLEPARY